MYRKRLKSVTGCLRCKHRHRKCDEKKPQCSFCARYNVACIWPTQTPSQPPRRDGRQPETMTSQGSNTPSRQLVHGNVRTSGLDAFHDLPVRYPDDVGMVAGYIRRFVIDTTRNMLPFDVANTQDELTRGWLALSFTDEVVCMSFVTYCAWFYTEKASRQTEQTTVCLRHEARSLALLRRHVEQDNAVTEGTLLAASLHFFITTFSTMSISQISRIGRGIAALVRARGGPDVSMLNISSSTKQSLIFVDIFNSLVSAEEPFLRKIQLPPRPRSYDSLFSESAIDYAIVACLEPGVIEILKDLHFALFFRTPSQQTRSLLSEESRYLFMVLQRISYGLCTQQSRLVASYSLSEIAVYGMILVKEQVLLDMVQHPIMPTTILRRLQTAILSSTVSLVGSGMTVALWSSVMALIGTRFETHRTWALNFIIQELTRRYGCASWPHDWANNLRRELESILWHHQIEVAFRTLCNKIVNSNLDLA